MGLCYYLAREDNHTLYELWKVSEWRDAFTSALVNLSDGTMMMGEFNVGVLTCALKKACDGMFWGEPVKLEYLTWVARDVLRWSEGKPFRFIHEQVGCLEDEESPYREFVGKYEWGPLRITGSRFQEDA